MAYHNRIRTGRFALGLAFASLAGLVVGEVKSWAQATANSSAIATPAPISSQVASFQSARHALAASFEQLLAQHPAPAQMQAWQQQNAPQLAALRQQAQALSAAQPPTAVAFVTDVNIPAGASQTQQDFLTARANLFNLRAQLYNQQLQSTGKVDEAKLEADFQKQNAAALQEQSQRAQVLATEAEQQPLPTPPPLRIPANATPARITFLTLRDQLMREEIQVHNQNLQTDPASQQAALQAWRQTNVASFQKLQRLAKSLTITSN